MASGDRVRTCSTPQRSASPIDDHDERAERLHDRQRRQRLRPGKFDPERKRLHDHPYDFHPMYSTSSAKTRNVRAAHSYNVAFDDEIGHFDYCGKVGTDANATCLDPLGADTNDGDRRAGPGRGRRLLPAGRGFDAGEDRGCLDIDGDFDACPTTSTGPARSPTRSPTGCCTRRRSSSPARPPREELQLDVLRVRHLA